VSHTGQQTLAQAIAFHRQGHVDAAESIYQRILMVEPHNATARHLLSLIRYQQKRHEEALVLIQPVAAAHPTDAEAQANLGNIFKELGRTDEALASYDRALAMRPGHPDILNNRGLVLADLKRFDGAVGSYDAALRGNPQHAEAWFNRGLALWHMHRLGGALESYDRALTLAPNYAHAWNNRGNVLRELHRPQEALQSHEHALAADPQNTYARGNIAFLARVLCDWQKAEKIEQEVCAAVAAGTTVVSPFVLLGYSSDPALQLQCARIYTRDRLPRQPRPLWKGEIYQHEKIRLAYLSSDFRQHPMSHLIVGMLELHDRAHFEIIGVSTSGDDSSAIRQRLINACDRFEDVGMFSDEAVARLVRSLEVDVLVDLNGYTEGGRPEILTYRPAPVQVAYLGFPATTGNEFTDYIIADAIALPFDQQRHFSEQIVHLPDCYYVNDSGRDPGEIVCSRAREGLPEDGFVFSCFSNGWKLTAPMFAIWMRLLKAVPQSVLWLIDTNDAARANIAREASIHGVEPSRIVFAPRVTPRAHLARHRLADLALDTLPYNGHTTACDALWMELPFITLRGNSFTGRVAASILTAVGMPDLITDTPEDYQALALRLANDHALLQSMRARLAQNRRRFPLFNTPRFCGNMEKAYVRMVQWVESGQAPAGFRVTPEA
jgi:predicted O-linked N-acetylglucosamine transferase (SPINDLY family)